MQGQFPQVTAFLTELVFAWTILPCRFQEFHLSHPEPRSDPHLTLETGFRTEVVFQLHLADPEPARDRLLTPVTAILTEVVFKRHQKHRGESCKGRADPR